MAKGNEVFKLHGRENLILRYGQEKLRDIPLGHGEVLDTDVNGTKTGTYKCRREDNIAAKEKPTIREGVELMW